MSRPAVIIWNQVCRVEYTRSAQNRGSTLPCRPCCPEAAAAAPAAGGRGGAVLHLLLPALGRRPFRRSVEGWHHGRPGATMHGLSRKLCRGLPWRSTAAHHPHGLDPSSHLIFTRVALKARGAGGALPTPPARSGNQLLAPAVPAACSACLAGSTAHMCCLPLPPPHASQQPQVIAYSWRLHAGTAPWMGRRGSCKHSREEQGWDSKWVGRGHVHEGMGRKSPREAGWKWGMLWQILMGGDVVSRRQ